MVLFAGFPKKCKHHEQLTHTNMQQLRRMPRKQHRRYRNYAAAANAAACAYPERELRRIVCWLLILSAEI